MKMWIDYTNHKGVRTSERPIHPISLRFGTSNWHREPQWLLSGWDVLKDEPREFAMKDVHDTRPSPTFWMFTYDTIRQVKIRLREIAKEVRLSGRVVDQPTRAAELAKEALALVQPPYMGDEPMEQEPRDRLFVPDTDDMPPEMVAVLGMHPGLAIKFAFVARAAGVVLPHKAEAELAYVHWQSLRAYLKFGADGWADEMNRVFNSLLAKARAKNETEQARKTREEAEARGDAKPQEFEP